MHASETNDFMRWLNGPRVRQSVVGVPMLGREETTLIRFDLCTRLGAVDLPLVRMIQARGLITERRLLSRPRGSCSRERVAVPGAGTKRLYVYRWTAAPASSAALAD